MDVAAEKATELPRLGKPRMKLNVHASHTGYEGPLCPENKGHGERVKGGQTGTNRGMPSMVDFVQELGAWDRAVATEGVHHPRIRCYRKGPAPPGVPTSKREREHRCMDAEMELPAEEHRPDDDHLTKSRYLLVHNKPS